MLEKQHGVSKVIEGSETVIAINNQQKSIVPCVMADSYSLGVGYFESSNKSRGAFWGLLSPHCLIQSWRGMKMLETLKRIEGDTLAACWYAGGHSLHPSDERYADKLAKQFPSREDFDAVRKKILSSVPTPAELESMQAVLRGQGMTVSAQEFAEEIGAGRLIRSLAIENLIADVEKERISHDLLQAEIDRPTPEKESLGVFFRDLGITLVANPGDGVGWVNIEWHELDKIIKSNNLWGNKEQEYILTTRNAECIKPPRCYMADTRTSYTFESARFCDGQFFVNTLICFRDAKSFTVNFPVEDLRQIMGVITVGMKREPVRSLPWWKRYFKFVFC